MRVGVLLYMAKDLPYFKFKISEWNDGNITLCSFEAQGLFINLCSIYWSQEGEVSLSKMKRRFSHCKATAWKELISDSIIKVEEDSIIINFLDEQFSELNETSKKNSTNASKGWEKRRKKMPINATPLPTISNGTTLASNKEEIRKEQIKEEEKIGENMLTHLGLEFSIKKLLDDEIWRHDIHSVARGKDLEGAARASFVYLKTKPERFAVADLNELKKVTLSWLENKDHGKQSASKVDQSERMKNL